MGIKRLLRSEFGAVFERICSLMMPFEQDIRRFHVLRDIPLPSQPRDRYNRL